MILANVTSFPGGGEVDCTGCRGSRRNEGGGEV